MQLFTTVLIYIYITKFAVKYARKSCANTPKTVVFYCKIYSISACLPACLPAYVSGLIR